MGADAEQVKYSSYITLVSRTYTHIHVYMHKCTGTLVYMHESYEYSVLVVEKKDISRKKKKNKKREKTDTTTATDVDSTYTNSIFHPNKLIDTFRVSKYGRSASRNTKQNKTTLLSYFKV